MPDDHNLEQYPRIALGLNMSLAEGIQDIHPDLVVEALRHGGIREEDIENYPVLIKATDNPLIDAGFFNAHPENNDQPAIELYSYKGKRAVSNKVLSHEAKHLANAVYVGETAFLSGRGKRIRKAVVAIASLIFGSYLTAKTTIGIANHEESPFTLPVNMVRVDILLCSLLTFEYSLRKQEVQAFLAMVGIKKQNMLTSNTKASLPRSVLAKAALKALLMPNFKR